MLRPLSTNNNTTQVQPVSVPKITRKEAIERVNTICDALIEMSNARVELEEIRASRVELNELKTQGQEITAKGAEISEKLEKGKEDTAQLRKKLQEARARALALKASKVEPSATPDNLNT